MTLSSVAEAAKQLRTQLKAAFPTIKFSVKSDSYSMGSSINVSWWDGPTEAEVKAIARQHESVSRCQYSGEILSGGNRYVSCDRQHSVEFLQKIADEVCTKFGYEKVTAVQSSYVTAKGKKSEKVHVMSARIQEAMTLEMQRRIDERLSEVSAIEAPAKQETEAAVSEAPAQPQALEVEGVTVTLNEQKHGVEVRFPEKPAQEVIAQLKSNGFRWSSGNGCWYTKQTDAAIAFANSLAQPAQPEEVVEAVTVEPEAAEVESTTHDEPEAVEIDAEKQRAIAAYEARIEAKRDRFLNAARKAGQRSTAAYQSAKSISDFIPFGQPILVGHHSEGRHRRDIGRINSRMRRSVDESRKAKYYEQRAASVGKAGISSDDPAAIDKLKAKLLNLQESQELMKAANKALKKGDDQALVKLGFSAPEIARLKTPDCCHRTGYAAFELSNNNAEINRLKKRIAELEAAQAQQSKEYQPFDGLTVCHNVEENRIQLIFDDIPPEETRRELKSRGFKFSRYHGAWQRHLNGNGIYAAQQMIKLMQAAEQG